MRRFVAHVLLFAAIQLAVLMVVWRVCPRDSDHYMAATIDKHARLRAAPSPRVIFVGGSSVGFSVDSRPFEALGLEPVNMGLNDGLGLGFMVGEVAGQLRPGDVVIVAPEPQLYWSGSRDDAVWAVLERRPASVVCLAAAGPRAVADVFDQGLHFLARKVRCAVHQVGTDSELATLYRRSSFDARGDFVAHRARPPKHEPAIDRPWPPTDQLDFDRGLDPLRRLAARCDRVGARCYLAWCPMRAAKLARERETFERLERLLRDEVGLPMLESLDEAGHGEGDFYDRGPHLTGEAAARRSARLAERLAEDLAEQAAGQP